MKNHKKLVKNLPKTNPFEKLIVDLPDYMKDRPGVGGSDVSKIRNRFKDARKNLYLEMTGQKEREDLSNNEAVESGVMFEPVIREKFAEMFPEWVVYDTTGIVFHNPKYPDCYASLDGLVYNPEKGWGLLEVKNVSYYTGMKFGQDAVPEYMHDQVQFYMMLLDVKYCFFAVHVAGQKKLYRFVEEDKKEQESILSDVQDFLTHVRDKVPYADEVEIKPEDAREEDLELGDDFENLVLMRDQYLVEKEYWENKIALIENQLKGQMGEYTRAVLPSGRTISYAFVSGRKSFDYKGFLNDNPELQGKAETYWRTGKESRRFIIQKGEEE